MASTLAVSLNSEKGIGMITLKGEERQPVVTELKCFSCRSLSALLRLNGV
jgi:hypothetical protein